MIQSTFISRHVLYVGTYETTVKMGTYPWDSASSAPTDSGRRRLSDTAHRGSRGPAWRFYLVTSAHPGSPAFTTCHGLSREDTLCRLPGGATTYTAVLSASLAAMVGGASEDPAPPLLLLGAWLMSHVAPQPHSLPR